MEASESFFIDPKNIMALRSEHLRTSKPNDPSAKLVTAGLQILDYIYCLNNPLNYNTVYMHSLAIGLFKQAARANNSLGISLERVHNAKSLEEKNSLAICFAKTNLVICMMLLRDAAYGGHPGAKRNYQKVAQKIRAQIMKLRIGLKHKQQLKRRRMKRRKREEFHYEYSRNKYMIH